MSVSLLQTENPHVHRTFLVSFHAWSGYCDDDRTVQDGSTAQEQSVPILTRNCAVIDVIESDVQVGSYWLLGSDC